MGRCFWRRSGRPNPAGHRDVRLRSGERVQPLVCPFGLAVG